MTEEINGIQIPHGAVLLEPRSSLDQAIIGFDRVVQYDYHTLVDAFMGMGMSYVEAVEWIEYNTINAGANVEGYPQIIEDDEWIT